MAATLHGSSSHIFHHNHSHSSDVLNHQEKKSNGGDGTKELQIDDDFKATQSECKSENINVQAAFLHVLGDFIQSVGVIIAAVVIKFYVSSGIAIGRFMQLHLATLHCSRKRRLSIH